MIVLSGFLKEQITILFQKYGTRVPDCHRCSKAVTNLIPTAGEKIIQIKNYRNLKISPILKAPKVAQRTKVVLISQNYTLGLNGSGYVQWRICGRFSVGTTKKIERESDLHPPPKPPWHIAVVKHWR